jgi:hypothetical protein
MVDLQTNHGSASPTSSDRTFGLVMAAAFFLLALFPWWRSGSAPPWHWLAIAGIFVILALTQPHLLRPLHRAWFQLGLLLQKVVSPLVLGILFFVVFTPFGLLLQRKKDPLRKRFDRAAKTYWILRDPADDPAAGMHRQF